MNKRNCILMLFMTAILFSCAKKEDVTDKVPGVWETDWTDVLDGDLDDITVNEKIAFDSDGSFSQLFSGTVKFDDWENESEVSYLVAVEGRWEVEEADNIVLHYDMNQFATEIGKSDIEADYTDAAIGLLTGDMGDVFTGLLKSGNTDRLNKKVEAEVEKQITRYFKDMFHEINKDRKAFTNVEIHGNTMSADVNHGFFGREAVYDKTNISSVKQQGYSDRENSDYSGSLRGVGNPYSWLSEREVTASDVANLSKSELRILRNAIYAMHGHKFKSEDLTRHFSQYSWYHPEGDMSYALTSLERKNVEIIKSYE